jgi:hypothetical protein
VTQANFQEVGTGHASSVAWPTHAAGDLGILPVKCGATSTIATPTDWDLVDGFPINAGNEMLYLFTRIAASGAEGNAALSGGVNHTWGVICTARNAHQTKPLHLVLTDNSVGTTTTATAPGFNAEIDDLLVIMIFGWSADTSGQTIDGDNASLSDFLEEYSAGTDSNNGGGIAIMRGTKASPGAVAPTPMTFSTSTPYGVVTLAIAPIADTINSNSVDVDGAAAADGGTVRVFDVTQPAASSLCTGSAIAGGSGGFTASMPYDDHDYVFVYENAAGTVTGASEIGTPSEIGSFEVFTTGGGGGGLAVPGAGATYVR